MSNLKVQASLTGTGVVTLTAPTTNTDRTVTLPDQTGTVLTNAGPFTANASASAGAVTIDASNNVGIGTSSPQRKLDVTVNDTTTAQVYLRNNNASYASGMIVYNAGGEASMFRHNGGSDTSYAGANSVNIGSITNNVVAFIENNIERARFTSGNLLVGKTATGTATQGFGVYSTGDFEANAGNNPAGQLNRTNDGTILGIRRSNTTVGTISVTTTATAYNTSSDYRLKHDIQPMTGALARVTALKPVIYKWKADGSDGEGFIAHELAEVVPQCVTGEKDAVDEDGTPKYQGIDTSFLVATLTAAIQELKAELDTAKARIAALEAK